MRNIHCRPIQKMQSPVSGGCRIQRRSLCRSFDKPFYVNLCGNRMMQHHNSTLVEGFIDLNQSHSGSKMSSNPPGTNQGHCLSKCALCQRHGSWNDVCKQFFSVSSLIWQIVGCCWEGVTCCFVRVSRSVFAIFFAFQCVFLNKKHVGTAWWSQNGSQIFNEEPVQFLVIIDRLRESLELVVFFGCFSRKFLGKTWVHWVVNAGGEYFWPAWAITLW